MSAQKIDADRELKIRREAVTAAADTLAEAAASKGLNAQTAAFLRNAVLGVRDAPA